MLGLARVYVFPVRFRGSSGEVVMCDLIYKQVVFPTCELYFAKGDRMLLNHFF